MHKHFHTVAKKVEALKAEGFIERKMWRHAVVKLTEAVCFSPFLE